MIPHLQPITETVRLPIRSRQEAQRDFARGRFAVWDAKHSHPEPDVQKERKNEAKAAPPRPYYDPSMDTIKLTVTAYFNRDLNPDERQFLVDRFHDLMESELQDGGTMAPELAEATDFDISFDE